MTSASEPPKGLAVPFDLHPDPRDDPAHALPTRSVSSLDAPVVHDERPRRTGNKILYINFDGGALGSCVGSDPRQNCSSIFSGTVEPYSGDAGRRAAIIQVIRERFADFGITVTDERPTSGDYDMEMVGNWRDNDPPFAGIAPGGDCWDNRGGEISFTLEASATTDGMAEIVLQEVAHTWGLDHVAEQQDLLFPTTAGQNKTFRDACYPIVSDAALNPATGSCSHHAQACGTLRQQNSYRELLLIFGPSVPDTIAPTIELRSPSDGATVGEVSELVFGVEDDQRPAVVRVNITLTSDVLEESIAFEGAYASPSELAFPVAKLPSGTYDLSIEVRDESDNRATLAAAFTIDASFPSSPVGGHDGATSATDGDATHETTAGADDEAAGCRLHPTRALPHAGLLLLCAGLRRRTREDRRADRTPPNA